MCLRPRLSTSDAYHTSHARQKGTSMNHTVSPASSAGRQSAPGRQLHYVLPQAAHNQAQQDRPEGESNAGSRRMPSSAALARNS